MEAQKSTLGIESINKIQHLERNGKIDEERPHKIRYNIQEFFNRTPSVLYQRNQNGNKTGKIYLQGQDKFRSVRISQGSAPEIKTKGLSSSRFSELQSNSKQQNPVETPRTHAVVNHFSNHRRVPTNQYMVTTPNKKFQSYPISM